MIAIHLDAGHDRSGNPRRVYVVLDNNADIVEAIDEEYLGSSALYKKYPKIKLGPTLDTTFSTYRDLLREFRR